MPVWLGMVKDVASLGSLVECFSLLCGGLTQEKEFLFVLCITIFLWFCVQLLYQKTSAEACWTLCALFSTPDD